MSKILQFDHRALKALAKGIKSLVKIVSVTLGPRGRNVIIKQKFGPPLSTRKGSCIAEEVCLKDPFENIGIQLAREASLKTRDLVGDGTTTTLLLVEAMYSAGIKKILSGCNPLMLNKGINKAIVQIGHILEEMSTKVTKFEEIKQIASTATNNDLETSALIANAIEKVGGEGNIRVVHSKTKVVETKLKVTEGIQIETGYLSPYFITNPETTSVELKEPLILVTDKKFSLAKEIIPILERVAEIKGQSLLIIAAGVEGEALKTLILNKIRVGIPLCAIKIPERKKAVEEFFEELACLTGGERISEKTGFSFNKIDVASFGRAKHVHVLKHCTTIIPSDASLESRQNKIQEIRTAYRLSRSEEEKKRWKTKLSLLSGKTACILLDPSSESAFQEKQSQITTTIRATCAGMEGGVVPGGGTALLRAAKRLDNIPLILSDEEQQGVEIVKEACWISASTLARNTGQSGSLVAEKVYAHQGAWGFNALTEEMTDLSKAGIVDPLLVVTTALMSSSSLVNLLLNSAVVVAPTPWKTAKNSSYDSGQDILPKRTD